MGVGERKRVGCGTPLMFTHLTNFVNIKKKKTFTFNKKEMLISRRMPKSVTLFKNIFI